jgi:hypothetical protein
LKKGEDMPKPSQESRARRREIRRQLERKRRRQRQLMTIGMVAAAVLTIGGLAYAAARPKPGQAVADMGNAHIQPPETAQYNSTPPTSGPHYGQLARWGIHSEPIPNELQVHNLEDGGIMVQYDCPEGCQDLVDRLSAIVSLYDEQVILAPYPGIGSRIALTAWRRIDTFDELDEDRVTQFIRAFRGIDHHK